MCGLAGVVSFDGPLEADAAERLAAPLGHRGPDDRAGWVDPTGTVALAHRRLSIIDLSAAGRQPLADESGRLRLVYNGEVYNYLELRSELEGRGHRFRSATDTEVVLAAYREWGERCVERFRGMWAFALWDSAERRLFCSRDRFGIKPFLFRRDGRRLEFASELKAFRAAGPLRANRSVVRDYLAYGWVERGDETFVDGILRLPPAHSLVADAAGVRTWRYWRLEPGERPDDPAGAVREALLESIALHLRSDVPVGTCLSGGIDSSCVVVGVRALLGEDGERPRTFTAYFDEPGFDERPYARLVADAADAEEHLVTFGSDELVADLPAIVEQQDEPFGSTSIAAQWYVMREARRAGVKVILDGQGGDELFGGYTASFGAHLRDLLGPRTAGLLAREAAALRRRHGLGAVAAARAVASTAVPEQLGARLRARRSGALALATDDLLAAPARNGHADGSPFRGHLARQLEQLVGRTQLPELLRYEDRNSMAHSIEARVPFLDHRLVELAFSLENGDRIAGGRTKAVLRDAFADLLPPAVRDRTDKMGFVTPQRRLLAGPLGLLARDVLSAPEARGRGFVAVDAALARLDAQERGEAAAGFELWRALNLELWARAYLD